MTMRGEKVYECDFDVQGVTDFGIALDAILSGKEKVPPQGARVDVAYAGTIKGRVTGSIRGVDYQVIRAGCFASDDHSTRGICLYHIATSPQVCRTHLSLCGDAPLRSASRR